MVDNRTETVEVEGLGDAVAAVLDLGRLEALRRERELLRRLALGELEAAAGEGDDLEAVLDDCALLLEES
jgi:hypothetical protein